MSPATLTLRLGRALSWARATRADMLAADDGVECYPPDAFLHPGTEEGPRSLWPPRTRPAFTGAAVAAASPADAAAAISGADAGPGTAEPRPDRFVLPEGKSFAIRQIPLAAFEDADTARAELDAFLRDSWWEGHPTSGDLVVRRVAEDGKKSVQFIRETAS